MFFAGFAQLSMSWCPPKASWIDSQNRGFVLRTPQVFFYKFGSDTDDVLTFPIFYHVERLQCADDVFLSYARHHA
jgi:hypothetical protein